MRREPRSSPEEHSSNIRASTGSHCRGLEAANIPAAAAEPAVPGARAGRNSYPGIRRRNRCWNSSAAAGLAAPLDGREAAAPRRPLIVLLRRLTYWLLLVVGVGSLGPVRWSQIVGSCCLLRLIGLSWLTLGAGVGGVGLDGILQDQRSMQSMLLPKR